MRQMIRTSAVVAGLTIAAPAVAPAFAQQGGVTSGPSSGTPTTLGTGGESATPHQQDSLKNKGGPAVQNEKKGQAGGTQASIKPGAPDQESGTSNRAPKPQ
jgi:hypothetical protein